MKQLYTCVLIDDDLEEHEIFLMALDDTKLPATCIAFQSWERASEYLDNPRIDAPNFIFVDWHIFGLQSDSYIIGIRKIPKLNASQIIIYSGFEKTVGIDNVLQSYNCKYLKKSSSIAVLSEEMKNILISDN